MRIEYLNPALRALNDRARAAFANARGLSEDQLRDCRWLATGMPASADDLSPTQQELVAELKAAVQQARAAGVDRNTAGWCFVAAQAEASESGEDSLGRDEPNVGPAISAFLDEHLPAPASVLDVASWTGRYSRPLAARGHRVSLLDPAAAALELGLNEAQEEGVANNIESLLCGEFADLHQIDSSSYDLCLCLGALLYVHPRSRAEAVLAELARIASRGVIVEVESKYGLLGQLAAEGFDVSAEAVEQILTTGNTPPARPESGGVIYSCFSSAEFIEAAVHTGLHAKRLVGLGRSLTRDPSLPIPADEALRIDELLQKAGEAPDSFPSFLALCTKSGPQQAPLE